MYKLLPKEHLLITKLYKLSENKFKIRVNDYIN